MVSFAVDIENPRILRAMKDLGIAKSDLINKLPSHFYSPKISSDIQDLRFQYYQKHLNSLVSEIREYIKSSSPLKRLPQVSSSTKDHSMFKSKFSETCELNFKQKNFLLTALSSPSASSPTTRLKLTQSVQELPSSENDEKSGKTLKEFQKMQKIRLKELKQAEMVMQKTCSDRLMKSMKDHELREQLRSEEKKKEKWEKDWIFRYRHENVQDKLARESEENEAKIQEKLEKLDKKIQKSAEAHQEFLKKKAFNAQRARSPVERIASNLKKIQKNNEIAQINKLYDKQIQAFEIRAKNEEMGKKEAVTKREIFEKQRERAFEKIKQSEAEMLKYSVKLEKRILQSQVLVEKRKEELMKEIAFKQEVQRLKMQEKEMVLMRAKRKMENKALKMLEKQMSKKQRVEEIKSFREKEAERNRDLAIQMMIQKDKVREAVLMVSRSPKSQMAQEKLRQWNLVKKSSTPEESI